jgi:DNA-binding PadR family transcriptional regulator
VLATASQSVYKVCMTERAMQEATFLILTALADGSQHGYGIIAEVEEISGGRVRLRRYYRLTPEGTRRLAAEAARLQANARAALTRLNPSGVVT